MAQLKKIKINLLYWDLILIYSKNMIWNSGFDF